MTRKTYIELADTIRRDLPKTDDSTRFVRSLLDILKTDNRRFSADRFIDALGDDWTDFPRQGY